MSYPGRPRAGRSSSACGSSDSNRPNERRALGAAPGEAPLKLSVQPSVSTAALLAAQDSTTDESAERYPRHDEGAHHGNAAWRPRQGPAEHHAGAAHQPSAQLVSGSAARANLGIRGVGLAAAADEHRGDREQRHQDQDLIAVVLQRKYETAALDAG